VKEFKPPEDAISRIMELTELHTSYGIGQLANNKNFMQYVVHSRTNSNAPSVTYSHEYYANETRTETIYSENESHIDETNKSTDYEETVQYEPTPLVNTTSTNDELTTVETPTPIVSDPIELPAPIDKGKERASTAETLPTTTTALPVTITDPEHLNHLAKDVFLAIACGYTMDKRDLYGKRMLEFFKCLRHEIVLKCDSNKPYYATTRTHLDHPIALARELAACHHNDSLLFWRDGITDTEAPRCILSHKLFNSGSNTAPIDKMIESLHAYAKAVLTSNSISMDLKATFIGQVRKNLNDRSFAGGYHWYQTYRPRAPATLSAQSPRPTTASSSRPPVVEGPTVQQEHSCPTPDERTAYALDLGLPECLESYFKKGNSTSIRPPAHLSINQLLTNVITEICKHNANWNTPSFTLNNKHIKDGLIFSKIKIPDNDQSYLLWTVSAILPKLRTYAVFRKDDEEELN
jgi:hypothetical protein